MKTSEVRKQRSDEFKALIAAFSLRLAFVFYAQIHDYYFHVNLTFFCLIFYMNFQVNFTDIDYKVFSEGAKFVFEGKSPYLSQTYRYSPFLAWFLLPVVKFPDFGLCFIIFFSDFCFRQNIVLFCGYCCWMASFKNSSTSKCRIFRFNWKNSNQIWPSFWCLCFMAV